MKKSYIYITASQDNKYIYVGVTSKLRERIWKHKNNYYPKSYTCQHKCYKLVYYEIYSNILDAIKREKKLKKWKRSWKNNLINEKNAEWKDLYDECDNIAHSAINAE